MPPVDSISIVLPLFNQQHLLNDKAVKLLENTAEWAVRAEILLIDDASSDATPEVADDLRRTYPQFKVARHPKQLGPAASAQTGLALATGDLVFVREAYEIPAIEELQPLWDLRADSSIVMARARTRTRRIDNSLLKKLSDWGRKLEESWVGKAYQSTELQMFRRLAMERISLDKAPKDNLEITHLSHRRVATPKLREHLNSAALQRNS